ncbi:MAG: phosphoglucomutase (alpha-D-glucose-1,6-bisphosphate-dependent) [Acidobacteria bacterium]|nr:phosphoglucomutase (alpha-D-glucose-1,6-bisphosphate-dependent) [Acidobacteriota bacterium]
MSVHPAAGTHPTTLVDLAKLEAAYYSLHPDPANPAQRVSFGTSGHRGSSLNTTFNEDHILATTQAIVLYRKIQNTNGPLFLGIDTHPLSVPAYRSALEVLAANSIEVRIAPNDGYTPTPAISHAILNATNADGIVITPSHNPPEDGGFKYNPPTGGPAGSEATTWIQNTANEFLANKLHGVKRIPFEQALKAPTTVEHDFMRYYIEDLDNVIDFDVIRASGITMGADPLGGAGVHYWAPIADYYKLNLTVVNDKVDKTFSFMTLDWDGKIRMDPSSSYTMQGLIGLKDRFDVAFACDTDHDRHGIVTKSVGLLPPNHYLATCIHYLFTNRPEWGANTQVGKTIVSSSMIDRVAAQIHRKVYEVPVGFKWFVDGLVDGSLGFVGEESAGATFLRRNGKVWTTDKDGITAALLAAEITAKLNRDPGDVYKELTRTLGDPSYARIDAPANSQQKKILSNLKPSDIKATTLAREPIQHILTTAPGNNQSIGGLKLVTEGGWCAARPSGTEDVYKIYAESYHGPNHLQQIQQEAQLIIAEAFKQ